MKLILLESRARLIESLEPQYRTTYKLWESAGLTLKEFALDPAEIEKLFAQIEQDSTAAGTNRTAIGKGIDTATEAGQAVKKAYDDLVDKVQNSTPMQNADAMYDQVAAQLKAATGGDQGVMKYVQKYRDFAEKHPVAQSFIYSALIAAAGISGAGLGGAAVLGLLKMSDQLLQGKKFSTALGKGAMTGAMAYGAGQVGQALQGSDALPSNPNAPGYDVGAAGPATVGNQSFDLPPEVDTAVDAATSGSQSAASTAISNKAAGAAVDSATDIAQGAGAKMFQGLATDTMADSTIKRIADSIASGQLSNADLQHLQASQGFVANALNNADPAKEAALTAHYNVLDKMLRAANNITVKESRSLYIDRDATIRYWALNESLGRPRGGIQLTEAGVMQTIRNVASNVGQGLKQAGKNITTKITADKLKKAWEFAGAPTDSEEVTAILQGQGVDTEVIDQALQTVISANKKTAAPASPAAPVATTATATTASAATPTEPVAAPAPAAAKADVKQVAASVATMSPEDKAALVQQLRAKLAAVKKQPVAAESFRRLGKIVK